MNGTYQVSTHGNVRNIKTGYILKPQLSKSSIYGQGRYYKVVLWKSKHGGKNFSVHRLVAQAFIPNPDNLPQINHKDHNPFNNHVDNLEWCTAKYNCNHKRNNRKPLVE